MNRCYDNSVAIPPPPAIWPLPPNSTTSYPRQGKQVVVLYRKLRDTHSESNYISLSCECGHILGYTPCYVKTCPKAGGHGKSRIRQLGRKKGVQTKAGAYSVEEFNYRVVVDQHWSLPPSRVWNIFRLVTEFSQVHPLSWNCSWSPLRSSPQQVSVLII